MRCESSLSYYYSREREQQAVLDRHVVSPILDLSESTKNKIANPHKNCEHDDDRDKRYRTLLLLYLIETKTRVAFGLFAHVG